MRTNLKKLGRALLTSVLVFAMFMANVPLGFMEVALEKWQDRNVVDAMWQAKHSGSVVDSFVPRQALAAASFKAGTFQKRSGTGSQSVSDVGFQPKALIFYWSQATTTNFKNKGNTGVGFVTATNNERAVTYWTDPGGSSNTGRGSSASSTIVITTTAGALVGDAALTSMDAGGFTLNWTTSDTEAYYIQYLAFGGADIANATSSTFSMTTSGATQAVSGLGFQPDFLFFLPTPGTTNGTYTTVDAFLQMGFAAGASSEGLVAIGNEDAEASAVTCAFSDTSTSILSLILQENSCASIDAEANLASFDADGFTINKPNLPSVNTNVFYLAIEGGQWTTGTFNKRTSAGSDSVSGFSFQPVGIFLSSIAATTTLSLTLEDTKNDADAHLSIGAASGASSEGFVWTLADDLDGSPDPDALVSSTSTIAIGWSPAGAGVPTIHSQADLTSFDSTGFTLNWLKSNASTTEILYWAVGNNPANPIKVSGTLYSDEGSSAITTAGIPIKLVVATATPGIYSTTTCSGCNGFFEFNGGAIDTSQFAAGTPFHVYVDGSAIDASTITKASSTATGANITNVDLYQNRLIVKHEATSATSTTNADLGLYDGDNDTDIRFKVDGSGNLTVASSTELHVWTGDTYAPGGTVTVAGNQGSGVDGSIHIDDSATFTQGGAITLAGSWAADLGAIFTADTNGVTFNATTSSKVLSGEMIGSSAFGTTTFNGTNGAWTFSDNASTTGFTISAGTVTLPSRMSISGDYTNNGSVLAGGTILFDGANQTISGTLNTSTTDFASTTFLGSGTKTFSSNASTTGFTIQSGVTVSAPSLLSVSAGYSNSGSFTDNSGTVLFDGASQNISGTLNTSTTDFASTTFLGSGTKTISSNASTTDFIIGSGVTVVAPSLLSVTGNYTQNGSFTDNSGTVYFAGGDTLITGTANTATTDFASVVFLDSASINANASTTNFTIVSGTVIAPTLLSVSGDYSNSGSFSNNGGTVLFDGASQTISGTLNTSATDFASTTFLGSGTKTFSSNASTTGFVIGSGVTVSAPPFLSVFASYSNSGSFTDNGGTVMFTGGNISGTLNTSATDFSSLVFFVGSPSTFLNNASTTNMTIQSSGSVVAPSLLSIAGNYSNSGDFTGGSGTVYLSGSSQQTLSGQMTGTSDDFNNLTILNTSGTGGNSGAQSVVFAASASTTGTFTMAASTSAQFLAGGTYTFPTLSMGGTSAATRTWMRSSSAGSAWNIVVSGSPVVSYVDVKDSSACLGSTIDADDGTNFDSTGNTCWDFTAPILVSISGTLYSDEGSTAITTAGNSIKLAIGTTTPGVYSTSTCSGCSGLFRFLSIDATGFGTGTPMLAWVDGSQALRAASLTKASSTLSGANITELNLYKDRLIVKHEETSGTSTTNADLDKYDGDNDGDIMYKVSGSDLSLSSSTELHVWTGDTFAPGGTVTVHGNASTSAQDGSIHIDDSAVFTAGGLVKLAGSFAADTGSTFTAHADGLLFFATTTGKTLAGTLISTNALGSTTFGGAGGAWTFSNNASTTNLRILAGTTTAPSFLSISGDYVQNGSFIDSTSTVLFDGTTQAISGTLNSTSTDFAFVQFLGSGTKTISSNASTSDFTIQSGATVVAPTRLTVSGNYSNSGTFTHNSGTIFFASTTSGTQTVSGTLTGSSAFNHVVVGGPLASTTWSNNASTSNLTITTNSTTTAPSLLSIIGNYSNSGLFKSNSGTVYIASTTGPQTFSGTMSGTSAFNNLTLLAGASSATTTFSATTTASGTFTAIVPNTRIAFPAGATTTLQNITIAGSEGSEVYLHSDGTGGYQPDGYTKLLLHMDGSDTSTSFPDSSSPAKTMTANGNAQVDTAQSKFGGASGLFDGTGDYVDTPDHADYTFGSGDWTVDLWFNRAGGDGVRRFIAGVSDPSNTQNTRTFDLRLTAGNVLEARAHDATTQYIITGTTAFTATGWHHLALVRTGNTLKLFVDGVQEGGDASMTTSVNDSSSKLAVGRAGEIVADTWNGWIDEFRISVGVARWTSNFTPLSAAYANQWKLDVSGTRSVSYANVKDSWACTSAGDITTSNSTDSGNNNCWSFPVVVLGDLVVDDHAAGQFSNIFSAAGSYPDANAFAFSLATTTEAVDISSLILDMTSVRGISTSDVTNAQLFVDYDADGVVDAGDLQVGGSGSVSITGTSGTTTFSTSFQATTTRSYIFQADFANISGSDRVRLALPVANITATGATTLEAISATGAASAAYHFVSGSFGGGGGGGGGIDNTPPPGQGTVPGGGEGGGSEQGGGGGSGQGQQGGGGSGGGGEVYVPLPRVLAFCQGDLLCTLQTYFLEFTEYNSR